MADEQPTPAPAAAQQDAPLIVNLNVVSPSVGVGNLRFPNLPASTTVLQLKDKIREALPSRPADESQRLIHRGRLLARDTDTLQDVLGEEAIRTSDVQTIHLVVRDAGDHSAPSQTPAYGTPTLSQSPAPGAGAPRSDAHANIHNLHHQAHLLRNTAPGVPNPALFRPGSAPIGVPQANPHFTQHHLQQHQELLQRINQLQQREASYRQLLAQQQNHRATMGQHIPQDAPGNAADPTGGRNSPVRHAAQTVAGPDGQIFGFRITVNEVVAPPGLVPRPQGAGPVPDPIGQRPLSAADVHNIIHGADATRAAQAMTNAMQRNASGAPPANVAAGLSNLNFNSPIQPIQPGVTTPIFPGVSRNASRTATPDPSGRPASHANGIFPSVLQPQAQTHSTQGQPEVYILSSPTGPRGLLINNSSEMYTTTTTRPIPGYYRPPFPYPQQAQTHSPQIPGHTWTPPPPGQAAEVRTGTPPVAQQQPLPQPHAIRRRPVAAPAAPPAAAPQAHAPAPAPAPQLNHIGNPGAGALVAALWPHIWLIVRLIAFAWWFSYSDPSWERWLSLALAFLVVFAINTGIFNGVVNNAFHPVREQLEGMIPFADPNRPERQQQQGQQQQNQQENQNGGNNGGHPDPAQVAARLVAQRRAANGNWLVDQLRRIERAGILFLASFAPGVAERHIQQLEERERAERRAAEEARAAAERAAAEQAAQEAAAAAENQEGGQEGQGEAPEEQQQQQQAPVQPQPPLVEA